MAVPHGIDLASDLAAIGFLDCVHAARFKIDDAIVQFVVPECLDAVCSYYDIVVLEKRAWITMAAMLTMRAIATIKEKLKLRKSLESLEALLAKTMLGISFQDFPKALKTKAAAAKMGNVALGK